MLCPKCGTQNIEGVTFCGACGAQLKTVEEPPIYYRQINPPAGGAASGGVLSPKTYLTEAIIVTSISFFCCMFSIISLVLGIIAIVKASNVTADFQAGQIDKALNDADTAKKLTIWAAVIAIVWPLIIVVIVPFIIGVSILGYLGALAGASGSF